MSSPRRRAERAAQFEAESREAERLAARSIFQKIEDAENVWELREILHAMVEKLGLE